MLVGTHGVTSTGKAPQIVVDSTPMALAESADIRAKLAAQGVQFLAAPVSGNAHVIKAGKLTVVACTRRGWMLNRLFPPPLWRRGSTAALYRGRRARDVKNGARHDGSLHTLLSASARLTVWKAGASAASSPDEPVRTLTISPHCFEMSPPQRCAPTPPMRTAV